MIANSIADGILICRCYYLWAGRKSIIAVPVVLYTLNSFFILAGLLTEMKREQHSNPPFLLNSISLDQTSFNIAAMMSLAYGILTLVTNLFLTALIAGRIFWLTRTTNSHNNAPDTVDNRQITRLILITVESGCLYALTLIVGVCFIPFMSPAKFMPILAQTMGIAPTLIMVRVDLTANTEIDLEKVQVV
ncbi:hypothetical protein GYMLUDRAFT_417559 [Collybiopsis luxurians FD-317 M1]|uniref:Uncharacterized protein n=1 Tax=Collybiopsis luxurians FD-317 M1 TaxID=944289 RepID=A0A0D0C7Z6_9AGAR|nr:hypothetical protein GYMLUDRAFT_417559 [Collybiopsis luxurians FD-317 M1]